MKKRMIWESRMTKRGMQGIGRGLMRAAPLWLGIGMVALSGVAAQAQTRISNDAHGYPRVRKLANGEVLVSGTSFGTSSISIFASSNEGVSFTKVGSITDPDFADGLCCGTIFQLPQA